MVEKHKKAGAIALPANASGLDLKILTPQFFKLVPNFVMEAGGTMSP